jgi:hypothetical protein
MPIPLAALALDILDGVQDYVTPRSGSKPAGYLPAKSLEKMVPRDGLGHYGYKMT